MTDFSKYYTAVAADDAFSVELTRVYGAIAQDARYYVTHDDHGVNCARLEKQRTGDEWLDEMKANR